MKELKLRKNSYESKKTADKNTTVVEIQTEIINSKVGNI